MHRRRAAVGIAIMVWLAGIGIFCCGAARAEDAPDSAAESTRASLFPIPIVFYQPETGVGAGFGLLRTYRASPDARTSSNTLFMIGTLKGQYSLSVKAEAYASGNRWAWAGELGLSRFPGNFYGIGNSTSAKDEETVTLDSWGGLLDVRRRVARHLYVGLAAGFQHGEPREIETGGIIDRERLPGSAASDVAFTGPVLLIDTRDRIYAPTRGGQLTVSHRFHDPAVGSDWSFHRTQIDARSYAGIGRGIVLATQGLVTISSNNPRPFYELPTLGGPNVLRGVYEGRYRDRNRVALQSELRVPLAGRIAGTAFLSAGQVMRHVDDARLDRLHVGGGTGVLITISERDGSRLRIDVGFTKDDSGFYFAFGEAF